MRKLFLTFLFLTKELITYAQSVYMHEAQEDNGELDFETFLQSLVIIIPGFLIWLLISSYIKDNKIKKGQAIRQLKKQKEDERERQYQRDSENFRAKLNCKTLSISMDIKLLIWAYNQAYYGALKILGLKTIWKSVIYMDGEIMRKLILMRHISEHGQTAAQLS